ncbi:MAG: guanylate kinase [Actinomycetota bacterium]|nr:guanylate kinase [Actinomycetota bacterium]
MTDVPEDTTPVADPAREGRPTQEGLAGRVAPAADRPARLTVLSGPSGVGKGTVVAALARRVPSLWVSVSVTTRVPRPGEVEGVSYHFVTEAEFDRMIAADELLEYATFGNHRYGTPRRPVQEKLAAGVPALLEIDLQGARQVRALMPEALCVFLAPPSWDELVRRLTRRGTEAPEVAAARLERARVELAAEAEFDAVVVNESIEHACHELITLLRLQP